jgi:(2R)-sulfolactate sulfo-lyase subunit alpha
MNGGEIMIHFLVHSKEDTVGVAIVDITSGGVVKGVFMDTQEPVEIKALQDIPLCHKIALKDMKVDDTVIKYGHDIGKVVANIKAGEYVHTQNLKTKRW